MILSKEFIRSIPGGAEFLKPTLLGKVIAYAGLESKRLPNGRRTDYLICTLDNDIKIRISDIELASFFFADNELDGSIEDSVISTIDGTYESVKKALPLQPKWVGAVQGKEGMGGGYTNYYPRTYEYRFGIYTIVGYRIRTKDGKPSLRHEGLNGYFPAELRAEQANSILDIVGLHPSKIRFSISEGYINRIAYDYLLIPIK